MRSLVPLALAALALGACGGHATSASDGGPGGADAAPLEAGTDVAEAGDVEAGVPATASFTVTATLSLMPTAGQGSWDTFPKTHTFTMFVDTASLAVVAGTLGQGTAVALSRTGDAFTTKSGFSVPISSRGPCESVGVMYDQLSFSIVGGRLTGTARGKASTFTGDFGVIAAATATLAGGPDVDPPTILLAAPTIDPMGGALFAASEPLAESAASLIGVDGDVFALGAQISDGPPRFTTGFVRSSLMLSWGTTYEITTEALTDFAGNVGARLGRPKVATPPAPPVAPEDGFESLQSATFGGAAVLPAGPFAGTKSLAIVGGFGNLAFPNAGPSVTLRLPVAAADKVVRFAARVVSTFELAPARFLGEVRVGVPGREVNVAELPPAKDLVKTVVPNEGTYYVGPVTTVEVPLPLGTNPEVSFQIAATLPHCGPPLAPVALVIDDLRVE